MPKANSFDRKRLNWKDLWEGPFLYRAQFNNGVYSAGHSLSEIESYGREFLQGIASISIAPAEGGIVIDWNSPFEGISRQTYHGTLSGITNLLTDTATSQLSASDKQHRKVLTIASSIRDWLERDFRQAVDAGYCNVWARVGSRVADFTMIPPDVFGAYKVTSWGYGKPGASFAEKDGLPTLYSIYLSSRSPSGPNSANHIVTPAKPGRRPNLAWPEAIEIVLQWAVANNFNRSLRRGQKTLLSRKLLETIAEITGETFSDNAARGYIERVIERLPNK